MKRSTSNVALEDLDIEAQESMAALIQEELARIVTSIPFHNSKQSQQLLRYMVEQTLAGNGALLKERLIGVEVFGRAADYDSNADPIVRSRATDVRKRLAQYYVGEGAQAPIRIEINPGAYCASFSSAPIVLAGDPLHCDPRKIIEPQFVAQNTVTNTVSTNSRADSTSERPRRFPSRLLYAFLATAMVLIFSVCVYWFGQKSAINQFWNPFLKAPRPLLIYAGSFPIGTDSTSSAMTSGNLSASVKVASLLSQDKQNFDIRSGEDIAFDDLRQFPAVLIGSFDNRWTMLLNDDLQFIWVLGGVLSIRDVSSNERQWVPVRSPDGKVVADYAIVTRLLSSKTGQPLLILAGITDSGTRAAAEFVTSPELFDKAVASAPRNWPQKNIQFVLQTRVINGIPTTPAVVATRYW
jgi:hypothetical protein